MRVRLPAGAVPKMSLQLDACMLAAILTGAVTTWNNANLRDLNGYDQNAVETLLK